MSELLTDWQADDPTSVHISSSSSAHPPIPSGPNVVVGRGLEALVLSDQSVSLPVHQVAKETRIIRLLSTTLYLRHFRY